MIDMNFDQARFNMVEQQIRTWEVLDMAVLDLMKQTPREHFVPDKYRKLAYSDIEIPLAHGESMMHPKIEAHILQSLKLTPSDTVLEIGTGSGYLTALLAQCAKQVYSVDIHPEYIKSAAQKVRELDIRNVSFEEGDACEGWSDHAPYDAIAVTGSVPNVSQRMKEQLKVGGRMFVITGESPIMVAKVITRVSDREWKEEELFETETKPLVNAVKPPKFVF